MVAWLATSLTSVALAGAAQKLVTIISAGPVLAVGMALIGGGILWATTVPVAGDFWSALAGPMATHSCFKLSAKRYEDGTTDVVLERNSAWTSGLLGRRRINAEAAALMDKAAEAIQANGGKVVERKEI